MHLKFLARGTGSAAVAAAYLLAPMDAAGKVRAAVEVLRGDPMLVAAVADGLDFKYRYTSGVAAWSPEDAPTRPELERFVDEFEKTAWAGLGRDRYVWAVVLHRDDDGGVHVHLIAARCDLATGRSLNIAPPGWETTFDPLRDAFNYEHGWSRPDDPSRARPFRPAPHRAYQARAARRAGEDVEPDPRREIGMHLLELLDAGKVKDRAGVVAALEARGYDVPRQGDHYLTARDRATGERWRLKGALYERDIDRERFLREAPEPSRERERADGGDDPAAAAWAAVEKARRRRADYHRAYYGGPGRRPVPDRVRDTGSAAGEVERARRSAAAPALRRNASLAAHLERELAEDAVIPVTDAPASARWAHAGGGRGAAALSEAARAAGPDLSRALSAHVAGRERAVRGMSKGERWLAEAQQEVLVEGEDRRRRLTVGERARAVETVEGRLEAELSRRELELDATSTGPSLLRDVFSDRDARQSFAARDRGLERVEQLVREALMARGAVLQSIPFGRQCLSAAAPVRSGDAEAAPLPEWESTLRGAEQRVGKELDRLDAELVAIAGGEDLLAEAAGGVGRAGRTFSLAERWEVCQRARSGLEEELEREEAAVRQDPAGEELLRNARLEVLGAAGREAVTLGDRARIVKAAAEAKRQAEEKWNEEKAARVEALGRVLGGTQLLHAHLADRDPAAPLARSGYTLEDLAAETERRRVEAAQQARIEASRGRVEELKAGLPAEVVAASTEFANVDPAAPLARSSYTLEDLAAETERRRVEAAQQARIEASRGRVEELKAGLPAEVVAASTEFANVDPAAPLARSGYTLEDLAAETERRRVEAAQQARIEASRGRVEELKAGLPAEVVAASTEFANVDPAAPLARSGYTLEDLAAETERRRVEAAQQARIEASRGRVEELKAGLPAEVVAASTEFANVDPAAPLARSGYTLEDLAAETERRRVEAAQQARIEASRGRVEELKAGLPAEVVAASTEFANVDPAAPLARSGYTLEDLAAETERRRVEAAQQARIEASRGRVEELKAGLPAEVVAASTEFANVDPAAPLARSGYTLEDLAAETERRRVEAAQQARIEASRGRVEELKAGLPAEVVAASTEFANVDPAAPLARSGYTLEDLAAETERRCVEAAQQARIEARRGHVEELKAGLPAEVVAASTEFANVDPAAPLARSGYTLEDLAAEMERRRVEAAQHEADAGEKDESSEDLPEGWHQLPEVVQVRLAVHAVETKLPWRELYPGNPSHRPPAVSDKLLDNLAAATADEFVTKAIAEVQKSHYSNLYRTNSEKDHLHAATKRKHQDNLDAYKKAEANRRYFSRRPRQPTWAAAQHVVIKEYETKLLGVITAVCRDVQQWSPARIQLELQRLDALAPHQVPTHGRGEDSPVRGGSEPATKRLSSGAGARRKQDKSPTKD